MLKKLNENYLFEETCVFVLSLIGLICWYFEHFHIQDPNIYGIGITSLLIVGSILALVFNDFKYMAPATIYSIFSLGKGIEPTANPILLYIAGGIAFVTMIFFTVRNGINIKKLKSGKGLGLLAILSILPMLWHNNIKQGNEVMYVLYFAYFIYFLVYVLFTLNLNKNSFKFICLTFSYLAVMIFFECAITSYSMHIERPDENILSFWYFLGWGLCNEAGIMLCFSMPFIAILLIKSNDLPHVILNVLKSVLLLFGIVFTTSRGSYLFGAMEAVILFILILVFSKAKIKIILSTIASTFIIGLIAYFLFDKISISKLISDIIDCVFYNKLDNNGRKELWDMAVNVWRKDFLSVTFGNGFIAEYFDGNSATGYREIFVVYHSTFFEALATVGILGLLALGLHFFEKYFSLFKFDLSIGLVMFVGFLLVDLYGMIDNTYAMYYYMGPLVISLAAIDNIDKEVSIKELFSKLKKDKPEIEQIQ